MHSPVIHPWSGWSILSFSPIDQEIGQCLRLDCCSRLILDAMRCDLDCPLCHSSDCIFSSHDVSQFSRVDDRNRMGLKIWLQSLGRHVHSIAHLLVMRVVLLGRRQHFTDLIDLALNLLFFVLLGTLYHHNCTDHPIGCRNIEHHRLLLHWGGQNRCSRQHALELSERFICFRSPCELLRLLHKLI